MYTYLELTPMSGNSAFALCGIPEHSGDLRNSTHNLAIRIIYQSGPPE